MLLILNGIFASITVFIACELGQRMGDAFDGISSTIDKLDWYLFPTKVKRMLPTIIANAQPPLTLACFGSIICDRNNFEKVSTQ